MRHPNFVLILKFYSPTNSIANPFFCNGKNSLAMSTSLMRGFIGSKKMEFVCISCGRRWSPDSNQNYARWFEEQRRKTKDVISKYMGQDLLEAVVAGCAELIAYAKPVINWSVSSADGHGSSNRAVKKCFCPVNCPGHIHS